MDLVTRSVEETHILYRFYDDEERLLYIGVTVDPGKRMSAHCHGKSWWQSVHNITMQNFSSSSDLMCAEREAIKAEDPIYNVVHSRRKRRRRSQWGAQDLVPPAPPTAPLTPQEACWDWLVWQWWLFVSDPADRTVSWDQWLSSAFHQRWLAAS